MNLNLEFFWGFEIIIISKSSKTHLLNSKLMLPTKPELIFLNP
jgi:hypothetical protein